MMRLLYLYRYGILGGVTTQLANRLAFLTEVAEPHFAFVEDHGGRTAFGDYPHIHILPTLKEQAELIRAGDFDVVLPIDTPEIFAALRAAEYTGQVVGEVHTTTTNLIYLEKVREERIDAFFTPSAYLAGRIEDEFGYRDRVPCYVAPNCLDTDLFTKAELGVEPERPIVLWIGKLDDHKNWRGFLDVGRLLVDRFPECELILAGGETAPEAVAGELFREAERRELAAHFRWLPRVEYGDMPRLYSLTAKSGGVTLSTSKDESFGMTVTESLACGCPAVAAEVGAIPEILDGELASGLYPFFDDEAAARAVCRLLGSPDERAEMARLGREKVHGHYGIEAAGRRYVELLRRIREKDDPENARRGRE